MQEASAVGSPNIFLRKNFERRHIYKGIYLIKDCFKERFQLYLPVPHLKIRFGFYNEIKLGLKDLTRIAQADDEECEMFVDAMWEYYGIENLNKAAFLLDNFKLIDQFGATVAYVSDSDISNLKSYLIAYKNIYEWSINRAQERGYGGPYYSSDRHVRIIECLGHIRQWEKSVESCS